MRTVYQMIIVYYGICAFVGFIALPMLGCYQLCLNNYIGWVNGRYLFIAPNTFVTLILIWLTLLVIVPIRNSIVDTWAKFTA